MVDVDLLGAVNWLLGWLDKLLQSLKAVLLNSCVPDFVAVASSIVLSHIVVRLLLGELHAVTLIVLVSISRGWVAIKACPLNENLPGVSILLKPIANKLTFAGDFENPLKGLLHPHIEGSVLRNDVLEEMAKPLVSVSFMPFGCLI